MGNDWPTIRNSDHARLSSIFLLQSNFSQHFGRYFLSRCSFLVHSFDVLNCIHVSRNSAIHDSFNCFSKFAGHIFLWFSTRPSLKSLLKPSSNSRRPESRSCHSFTETENMISCRPNHFGLHLGFQSNSESLIPGLIAKVAYSALRYLKRGIECQSFPILSLASTVFAPPNNLSSAVFTDSISLEKRDDRISHRSNASSDHGHQGYSGISRTNVKGGKDAIEPKTGIKFPTLLDSPSSVRSSAMSTEVLVGTGAKSMKIVRIKTLKVYAFGLYVHPESACQRLGPKYAAVPVNELKNCANFYEDLLREDIDMTVRLVVNCNGIKISTVHDSFEKFLRNRLLKMNPGTDYNCLKSFGSSFTQDIPLPVGTTINFRQTAAGQLITEIGGKQINCVQSKDLCRAFFDIYVGDSPVSEHAKEEIAQNVGRLIRRC